ncbi:hypothetical protein An07g01020 [Aspergillus niger]|uniref:Uncharacterized protein n=2 Tax=Aspergillus niger TaxID=5061 RepID=A2QM69_ASPNC|nr:hypothetical protein An07g01020 [Aspergillus niger]CAK96550.1 hypothetical protein An07g01020 [Aspergillus niger]
MDKIPSLNQFVSDTQKLAGVLPVRALHMQTDNLGAGSLHHSMIAIELSPYPTTMSPATACDYQRTTDDRGYVRWTSCSSSSLCCGGKLVDLFVSDSRMPPFGV